MEILCYFFKEEDIFFPLKYQTKINLLLRTYEKLLMHIYL